MILHGAHVVRTVTLPDDQVLILPSSHLLETQEDLQNFINRRIRGVPGIG